MEQTWVKARILNLYLEHAPLGPLSRRHAAAPPPSAQTASHQPQSRVAGHVAQPRAGSPRQWRTGSQINRLREQWVARQCTRCAKSQRHRPERTGPGRVAWPAPDNCALYFQAENRPVGFSRVPRCLFRILNKLVSGRVYA